MIEGDIGENNKKNKFLKNFGIYWEGMVYNVYA